MTTEPQPEGCLSTQQSNLSCHNVYVGVVVRFVPAPVILCNLTVSSCRLVIDVLKGVEGDRRCFRLVGGVLVERTVKEVLPALEYNNEQVGSNNISIFLFTKLLRYSIIHVDTMPLAAVPHLCLREGWLELDCGVEWCVHV